MATKLTELHPLTKKLRKLESYMDQNKIWLEWDGYRLNVTDNESGLTAHLEDNESSENIAEMPYMMETKLIRE